jgi:hypothetical protein
MEHGEEMEGTNGSQKCGRVSASRARNSYVVDFGLKNDDIGAGNGYFWNTNLDISIC